MYIATGELRERLRDGSFPNELARWFKVADSRQSALEYFTGFKWQFLPLLVFFIVGILHIDEKSLSSTVLVIGMPLLALCYILVPLGKRAKRFKWFEENLGELIDVLQVLGPRTARPLHLMTYLELKEAAIYVLVWRAKNILRSERERPQQDLSFERTRMNEIFDFFRRYQLLDPYMQQGLKVFFERAKAELDKKETVS